MITVLDDEASINRAFEVGAIDYVTKPIHWAVLRQRVRRLLSNNQLLALHRSEQRFRSCSPHAIRPPLRVSLFIRLPRGFSR